MIQPDDYTARRDLLERVNQQLERTSDDVEKTMIFGTLADGRPSIVVGDVCFAVDDEADVLVAVQMSDSTAGALAFDRAGELTSVAIVRPAGLGDPTQN
jgi:hypothetical protein